jgi:hypothetical protein
MPSALDVNEIREQLKLSRSRRLRYYARPLFAHANLDPHVRPYRGLVWSFVVHACIFTALVSIALPSTGRRPLRNKAVTLDIDDLNDVIYLPVLGSSKVETKAPQPDPKTSSKTAASSKGTRGLSYPGPQPILSDFPNPTNHMQTLLQPSLRDPYVLEQPLLLPNIVKLAEASPFALRAPVPPPVQPKFKVPDAATPTARPTTTPQLDVALSGPAKPLAAPMAESKLKTPDASTPAARSTATPQLDLALSGPAKPLAAPLAESKLKTPDSTSAPAARTTAAPQLDPALNGPAKPLAAPLAESKLKVPDSGIAGARAPATPVPQLDVKLPTTAAAAPPPPPKPAGPASPPNDATQNLLALSPMPARRDQPVTIPPGEARGRFAISPDPNLDFPGNEPGGKSGTPSPTTPGSAATNAGTGTAKNATAASGNDAGPRLANVGPGNDPFPGITILGAAVDPPTSRNNNAIRNPEPLQTSYGIRILASGGSGGGLPDFGVFANEQVQTVYLDMRRTVPDPTPSWTVEYALIQDSKIPETKVSTQLDIVLPFPIEKEQPQMPADLVRKYPRRMIIAFGIINVDGKIEQLSIKDTPDRLLNQSVLDALQKWTFRPARRNGEVVAAKALFGIPLWTPE